MLHLYYFDCDFNKYENLCESKHINSLGTLGLELEKTFVVFESTLKYFET